MSVGPIPLFPLNTVLFPGGLLPLRIFEARYMDMARDCLKHQRPFGVCLIRSGSEVGEAATPELTGCLARIIDCDMQQLGILHVTTMGEQRFQVLEYKAGAQELLTASVALIPNEAAQALPSRYAACARILRLVASARETPVFAEPHEFDNAVWVGCRLSEILPLPLIAKQKLLELTDTIARLDLLQNYIEQHGLAER